MLGAHGIPLSEPVVDASGWHLVLSDERGSGMAAICRRFGNAFVCCCGDRIGGASDPPDTLDIDRWLTWSRRALLRGCGAVCERDRAFLWTDEAGTCPLFYAIDREGSLIFSTRAKWIVDVVPETRAFAIGAGTRPLPLAHETVFVGVRRVPAGTVLHLARVSGRWGFARSHRFFDLPTPHVVGFETAYEMLRPTLEESVIRSVAGLHQVHVTLSGGVDSSSVAAIASAAGVALRTVTVGSPYGDEFEQAAEVAQLLGSDHVEFLIDADTLRACLPGLILALECWDPLTLQIAAPAAFIYSRLRERPTVVLTGYGADLLFAGVADEGLTEEQLEQAVDRQVRLTVPTNEFTPAVADDHGVTVRYPYWSPSMLSLALSMRGRVKVRAGFTKFVLRKAAESWLPDRVAWRPKCGIHEGSSMSRLFTDCLATDSIEAQTDALRRMAARVLLDERIDVASACRSQELQCASF
jgi:carbapenam-3-carboxylate synthase